MIQAMTSYSRYPLARQQNIDPCWPLPEFCVRTGADPRLVRRYVALGLLVPVVHGTEHRFTAAHAAQLGRLQRLRIGLGLNYTALGVVCDLLDRITELEAALRTRRGAPDPTRPRARRSENRWT